MNISMAELNARAAREIRARYPEYTGAPRQHPFYNEVRTEMLDFLLDMWYEEPWRTAEGEEHR